LLFFDVFSIFRVFGLSGISNRLYLPLFWGFFQNFQKMAQFEGKSRPGQQCKKILEAILDPLGRHCSSQKVAQNHPKNEMVTAKCAQIPPNPPKTPKKAIFDPFFTVF
jgi:hypothetical protein